MNASSEGHELWGIVLAGGEGRRVRQFTRQLFGEDRPKQYCAFTGTRSLLRHTIARAEQVVHTSNLLTIVSRDHLDYARDELYDQLNANITIQPRNLDTGPGILLPLMKIRRRDPGGIVVILPSDHFIREENRLGGHLRAAVSCLARYPGMLVMLGAIPDYPAQAYGYIQAGPLLERIGSNSFHSVEGFWEKPTPEAAKALHAKGCLWNTLILAGRVETLLEQFRRFTPGVYRAFDRIGGALDTPDEEQALNRVFGHLPPINFSRAILERIPHHLGVIPMTGIYWNDWGDESRIIADCDRFGLPLRQRSFGTDHDSDIRRTDHHALELPKYE